jgi:hypothetical protein
MRVSVLAGVASTLLVVMLAAPASSGLKAADDTKQTAPAYTCGGSQFWGRILSRGQRQRMTDGTVFICELDACSCTGRPCTGSDGKPVQIAIACGGD